MVRSVNASSRPPVLLGNAPEGAGSPWLPGGKPETTPPANPGNGGPGDLRGDV